MDVSSGAIFPARCRRGVVVGRPLVCRGGGGGSGGFRRQGKWRNFPTGKVLAVFDQHLHCGVRCG